MSPSGASKSTPAAWSLGSAADIKKLESPVPSDMVISRSHEGVKIGQLCEMIGLNMDQLELYGDYKAKLNVLTDGKRDHNELASYVVVTGVTPTAFGEGKSTTMLGLVQALSRHLDRKSFACMRQPSQGPTFGMKGGAAGGGYSQVWPMDEFNLHLTGDIHAVTAANNLIAAAVDARMFHESTQNDDDLFRRLVDKPGSKGRPQFTEAQRRRLVKLGLSSKLEPDDLDAEQRCKFARLDLDPSSITINRVIDTNDRFLRKITVGQSATEKGHTRETKFTISVASELMAILALAEDFGDVCRRVERMVVGYTSKSKEPVTCDDLCVSGAVCALIKDAVKPTIMQTLEGTPVLVHCGPFANIAHGNSSIIADKIALDLAGRDGFVVTEAGFGSDVGFEKFMNIKCRQSGLMPHCAVLVATLRAIKLHGRDLLQDKSAPDDVAIANGLINLKAHIKNITGNFQVPCVVALNKFATDKQEELELVAKEAIEAGASDCQITDSWALGGRGAVDLAKSVIKTCNKYRESSKAPRLLYQSEGTSIVDKIRTVATKVYGASEVRFSDYVLKKIKILESNNYAHLPVCIAKTQLSISHDPKLKGTPSNYEFPIVECDVCAGAGFVYALAAEISTMPGLPTRPGFFDIKINPENGLIEGLF